MSDLNLRTAPAPITSMGAADEKQKTLKGPVAFSGVGVHSNRPAALIVKPADANTGIVFKRTDLAVANTEIPALWSNISNTRLATNIANSHGAEVSTIEHLMAAFAALGIDNALVDIDGPELPILDGSAHPFFFMLECRGLQTQASARRYLKVTTTIEINLPQEQKTARLTPGNGFHLDCHIKFDTPLIGEQRLTLAVNRDAFHKHLSRARTFGFLHQVEELQKQGLALGGSLEGGIVIDGDTVMNEEGLRFPDEFVRHKALDAVGDMYLTGQPILANLYTWRGGHDLHARLLKALMARSDAWELVTVPQQKPYERRVPLATLSRLAAAC